MARISVQGAKSKGRKLQQWVCANISEVTGFAWGSSGEDHPIESRPMGQSGTDVRMESHVLQLFPYSIECKAQEKWNIGAFIKQATTNILPNTDWLLICKKSRQDPIVVMDKDVLLSLVSKKYNIQDFHIRNFIGNNWKFDSWISEIEKYTTTFNKTKWILIFGNPDSSLYGLINGHLFFDLFDKAPLKRTK